MTCSCGDSRADVPKRSALTPRRGAKATRALLVGLAAWIVAVLAGCAAGPLPRVERPPSTTLAAPPDTPLAAIPHEIGLDTTQSGVWPLVQASFALDARIAMIRSAARSIDVQSYLIADDSIGRQMLRELRDAARRGVRVRVLVDDLYTVDCDRLLLGLAATPNAEVRLFNPIVTERNSSMRRLLALATDFRRLNHRMHNKLMLADGAVAVIGGRNLADEYFLRGARGNFIDFDLLVTGAVVPQLGGWFDLYWNSEQVFDVADVARASAESIAPPERLRDDFERVTRAPEPVAMTDPPPTDFFAEPPFSVALARRRFPFLPAQIRAFADSPSKIDPVHHGIETGDTLTHRFLAMLGDAHNDVLMFSPYFIPGTEAMDRLRQLRLADVRVRVVTNSLAVSDEPLVSIRFERHQAELLNIGVELFELSSTRLKLDGSLRGLLGTSTGRLHAKIALVDRRSVFVGSMNLDPRSATINTEIGIRVESKALAKMVIDAYRIDSLVGVYQVKLRPNGPGVRWSAVNEGETEDVEIEPDTSFWQRLQLILLSLFVPETEL